MSATQANALPSPDAAYQNLFDGVYARVFFNKCANAGLVPQGPEEAQCLLDMAADLRSAQVSDIGKTAEATNPLMAMRTELRNQLAAAGLDGNIKRAQAQEEEFYIKQAAAELRNDPLLFNSVLSLKAAEAEGLRQQYSARKQTV